MLILELLGVICGGTVGHIDVDDLIAFVALTAIHQGPEDMDVLPVVIIKELVDFWQGLRWISISVQARWWKLGRDDCHAFVLW